MRRGPYGPSSTVPSPMMPALIRFSSAALVGSAARVVAITPVIT
jgi:hypothetical protein